MPVHRTFLRHECAEFVLALLARSFACGYNWNVHRLLRWLGRLIGVLVVVMVASVAYLHAVGLPAFLKHRLEAEIRRTGIVLEFGAIRLDLFRGLVAQDFRLADARDPDDTWVRVDELLIEPNWQGLMQRRQPLRALRIVNANVAVPTPPDDRGSALFTAKEAYATVLFRDDGIIELDRLTGYYCGIQLYVTGLLRPVPLTETVHQPKTPSPFRFITPIVRELNRIQVSQPPELDLRFDVDMARPLETEAQVRFHGKQLALRGVQVDEWLLLASMNDGAVTIEEFLVKLYRGEVRLRGRYDVAAATFDLTLTSSTDPTALAAFGPAEVAEFVRRDVRVQDNPRLTARYRLTAETGSLPELTGHLMTGGLQIRGVDFSSIEFQFRQHADSLRISDARVVTPEGQLTGQGEINLDTTDFQYEFHSTLDPVRLLPLMPPGIRPVVEPAQFETPPTITATVRGDFVDPDAFAYQARVVAGRCAYRGVALDAASATVQLAESQLHTDDLRLVRPEGEITGTVLADFNEQRVQFSFTSTANPNVTAALLGPAAAAAIAPYRFGPQTLIRAQGRVDFAQPTATLWSALVQTDRFQYWKLTANRARASLTYTNLSLAIRDFAADFYSGGLTGSATFDFQQPDVRYQFDLTVRRADVNSLLLDIGGASNVTGFLTGELHLNGVGATTTNLTGHGHLTVNDGVLWEAPLFGIFSEILGKTRATAAEADFEIRRNAWRTENLTVHAGAFTATARGRIHFDGRLDFRVQAQFLRQVPGLNILTKLIGILLEYDVGGTLRDPTYRAANLPKELLPHTARKRENRTD
ncbi:MAG: AsmA-like C-terminal region-containing protein [Verrucomicrobiae bacterium]|nr:AsmA-like C-terminal region-containing protein [Verrucomicrobiae bacterium]